MADYRFITYHGWGFNSKCWQPWENRLSDYGKFESYDRGYFGNPAEISVASDERLVVLTHSFGLHWCADRIFEQAELLIIFGGFLRFHPHAAQFKRRSRLVLQQMINEFEVQPENVLQNFYQNCYAPCETPDLEIVDLDHELMLKDLRTLHESQLSVEKLKQADKLCILHGADDYIVPKTKGREIYDHVQSKAQYFEIRMAGHALPFSHERQAYEFLAPSLKQFGIPVTEKS